MKNSKEPPLLAAISAAKNAGRVLSIGFHTLPEFRISMEEKKRLFACAKAKQACRIRSNLDIFPLMDSLDRIGRKHHDDFPILLEGDEE